MEWNSRLPKRAHFREGHEFGGGGFTGTKKHAKKAEFLEELIGLDRLQQKVILRAASCAVTPPKLVALRSALYWTRMRAHSTLSLVAAAWSGVHPALFRTFTSALFANNISTHPCVHLYI